MYVCWEIWIVEESLLTQCQGKNEQDQDSLK